MPNLNCLREFVVAASKLLKKCLLPLLLGHAIAGSAGYLWVNCRVAFSWLYPLSNLVIGRSAQCDPGETNDSTRQVSQAFKLPVMFVCVRCACPVCRVKCCDPTKKVGFLGYPVVQSTSVVRCHLCFFLHICCVVLPL